MRHRRLGSTGIRVPLLGFGAMRLPLIPGRRDSKRRCAIDQPEAVRMIRRAYDLGIDYFDSAYGYHQGWSEVVLGSALKALPRNRVMITTKLPVWLAHRPADFPRLLRTQLRRLRTDYLDFYLLHALNAKSFETVRRLGVFDFLEQEQRSGAVRHIGFSFHDGPAAFRPIVDAYDWKLCQIQYNLVDTRSQAGSAGLRYAAKRGIGVVVMEPLRGGDLVSRVTPEIQRLWDQAPDRRLPAEWLLRWLWNQPEVSMVLSGMSTMQQLEDDARYAGRSRPFTPGESRLLARIERAYRALRGIPCTRCEYCMPCPHGVAIPGNFAVYNDLGMFPESKMVRLEYNVWMLPRSRASACTECGECRSKCPQQIDIPARLKDVARALDRG
jgi:hypothetical protein